MVKSKYMLTIIYITWHYTIAVLKILSLARNFLKAVWHKFFIGRHMATFFATWHRLNAKYIFDNENVGNKITNFFVGIFIRLLAAGMRSIVITIGLLAEVMILICFVFILVAWILWPVIFFTMSIKGVALMLS